MKNYKLDSLSSGSLLKFIFFMSKTPFWFIYFYLFFGSFLLAEVWFILEVFFYCTFCFMTIFFISPVFLLSSFSYNCFTISEISEFSPFKMSSLILLSNCILRSSNDNLEIRVKLPYKIPVIWLGLFGILWMNIFQIVTGWLTIFKQDNFDNFGNIDSVLKIKSFLIWYRYNPFLIHLSLNINQISTFIADNLHSN